MLLVGAALLLSVNPGQAQIANDPAA